MGISEDSKMLDETDMTVACDREPLAREIRYGRQRLDRSENGLASGKVLRIYTF